MKRRKEVISQVIRRDLSQKGKFLYETDRRWYISSTKIQIKSII